MDPVTANRFKCDLSAAQAAVDAGVSAGRTQGANTSWEKWSVFIDELALDPLLETVEDKISILQVFAQRVRTGELAANKNPIRARSTEDYVRHVAQTFLGVGAPDPRLNTAGDIDFRLRRMISAWKKEDSPPNRVKPIPIQVINHIVVSAMHSEDPNTKATADMIIIAFFYLLRPGEYTDNSDTSTPFHLEDVQLFIGFRRLNLLTAPDAELLQARFASLTFTDQKNGVRNEVIGLGQSGSSILCPVSAIVRRVIYLRINGAPPGTPLARTFDCTAFKAKPVTAAIITKTIRTSVKILGPDLGFLESDVSARCLRAAGANALLLANVDTDIIRLIGRWRSDEMLRYLHVQAAPLMSDYSRRMLNAGVYNLIPNQHVISPLVPSH